MNQAQVAKSNQIADFLRRRITFIPNIYAHPWGRTAQQQQLSAVEQFAQDLVADAEFRSLQLGTWLGTTDGEVIETAVGVVIPPIYKPEYDLAVNGLKLAARLQQQAGQEVAGKVALTIVGASLLAVGVVAAGRSAA
jgi:broad specificity phosphatase PhoE